MGRTSTNPKTLFLSEVENVSWLYESQKGRYEGLSTISSSTLNQKSIHILSSPVLKIERTHTENGSIDPKGSWSCRRGYVEAPYESLVFSLVSVLIDTVQRRIQRPQ